MAERKSEPTAMAEPQSEPAIHPAVSLTVAAVFARVAATSLLQERSRPAEAVSEFLSSSLPNYGANDDSAASDTEEDTSDDDCVAKGVGLTVVSSAAATTAVAAAGAAAAVSLVCGGAALAAAGLLIGSISRGIRNIVRLRREEEQKERRKSRNSANPEESALPLAGPLLPSPSMHYGAVRRWTSESGAIPRDDVSRLVTSLSVVSIKKSMEGEAHSMVRRHSMGQQSPPRIECDLHQSMVCREKICVSFMLDDDAFSDYSSDDE